MKEFRISDNNSGRKSATYLSKILPNAGFGFINKMIRKKNITLNDKKMTGNEVLQKGDVIKIYFSDETYEKFAGESEVINTKEFEKAFLSLKDIKIIYEDEDYIILDKTVGVLSQKASDTDCSLNEWLIGYLLDSKAISKESLRECKPSVCNRLDRNTSGLVLAGKTVSGLNSLNKVIKQRNIRKFYHAFTIGRTSDRDSLKSYLSKDEKNNKSDIISIKEYESLTDEIKKQYSYIETEYRLIGCEYEPKAKCDISKIEVELITGKSHQIRAQMAHIGHPLVGDAKYGDKAINKIIGEHFQLLRAVRVEFPIDSELKKLSGRIIEID